MMKTTDTIKVSVVIPAYNASGTIVECLRSVVGQSYSDWEVIVVNDGSGDDSGALVEAFMTDYPGLVRLINQENRGVSAARNCGIREARGEYIAFLDADDVWEPEKLDTQMKLMEDFPSVALSGTAYNRFSRGGSGKLMPVSPFGMLAKSYFNTSAVIAKKEAILEAGLFPESMRYSEDIYLWTKIAGKHACYYLDQRLTHSLDGAGGLSTRLWEMEKGQLATIRMARKEKMINMAQYLFLLVFSFLKYARRVVRKKEKR